MTKEEIRELRKRLGLTQEQFGKLLNAHPITVSRWESGEYKPDAYQTQFMEKYQKSKIDESGKEVLAGLLIGAGIMAAIALLFDAAKKK